MANITSPLQSLIAQASKLPSHTGATQQWQARLRNASANVIIIADVSGSMADKIGAKTKYDHLQEAITWLQGNVAEVIEFSSSARRLRAEETLSQPSGGTALHLALAEASACRPLRTIVVSDGEPDDEQAALVAAKDMTGTIDVIYCGKDGGPGVEFLRRLAKSNGGRVIVTDAPLLLHTIRRLALPEKL